MICHPASGLDNAAADQVRAAARTRILRAFVGRALIEPHDAKEMLGDKTSEETHYYISSLPLSAGAKSIAKAIRSHWAVENSLHWSLDVAFREDASQVRKDEGPANLACIRRLALTQLKRETSLKVGLKNKRSRAGWDPSYMETVLKTGALSI